MLGRLLTKLKREDSNPAAAGTGTGTGTGTGSPTSSTTSSPKLAASTNTSTPPAKPRVSTENTPTSPDTSSTISPSTPQSSSTSTSTSIAATPSPSSSKPSFFQRASSLLQSKTRTSTPSSTSTSASASASTSPTSEKEELETTSTSLPPVVPKSGSKTSSVTKSPARAPLHRDVSLILSDLITLTETLFNHQKPIQREVEHVTSQFEIWTSRDVVMELPRVMHAAHMMKVEFPASQTTAEPHLVQANQSLSDALTLCRATLTQADEMETGRSTSHAASEARLAVTRASIVTSMKQDTEEIEHQHEQELATLLTKYKRRKKGTAHQNDSQGAKTDTTATTTTTTTTTTSTTTTDASSAISTPSTSATTPTSATTATAESETPSTQ